MMVEYPMDFRIIHTDGRPHPKDPDPTFNGNSVAHWEKDTLVIDTIALDTRVPNFGGWFHSDDEHVVERINSDPRRTISSTKPPSTIPWFSLSLGPPHPANGPCRSLPMTISMNSSAPPTKSRWNGKKKAIRKRTSNAVKRAA